MRQPYLIYAIACLVILQTAHAQMSDVKSVTIGLVNQDPDPANAGDIVEVRLSVENVGGTAVKDLVVELSPEYPLSLVPGEQASQSIGTLQGFQYDESRKIIKWRVLVDKDATAGSYDLKVYSYEPGIDAKTQQTLAIDVSSSESAEVIYIDQAVLIPGQQTNLTFTIRNVGSAPLRELTFSWQNSDDIVLPVGSDNTRFIKYINVGQSATLTFSVIADTNADPGLYKLDLSLAYHDQLTNTQKETSTIAGVYVGGGTDFDVAFSESSSGSMAFTVANIGSNPASSVSVTIPRQSGWTVSGSNSVIIGNLNKGDYTVASFSLQGAAAAGVAAASTGATRAGNAQTGNLPAGRTGRNMTRSGPLTLQIAYTDTRGQRLSVEKRVEVTPSSTAGSALATNTRVAQQSIWSKYQWQIIIVAVLATGFTAYQLRKRRSKSSHKPR